MPPCRSCRGSGSAASAPSTSTCRSRSVVRPKRPFCLRVLLVADADQRRLEQPHDRGQHLLARQAAAARGRARPRRGCAAAPGRTRSCGSYLASSRDLAPARVVAVLLAAPRVAAGRLDVAVGERADPDVRPGRRDGERADAAQRVARRAPAAVGGRGSEALAGAPAARCPARRPRRSAAPRPAPPAGHPGH